MTKPLMTYEEILAACKKDGLVMAIVRQRIKDVEDFNASIRETCDRVLSLNRLPDTGEPLKPIMIEKTKRRFTPNEASTRQTCQREDSALLGCILKPGHAGAHQTRRQLEHAASYERKTVHSWDWVNGLVTYSEADAADYERRLRFVALQPPPPTRNVILADLSDPHQKARDDMEAILAARATKADNDLAAAHAIFTKPVHKCGNHLCRLDASHAGSCQPELNPCAEIPIDIDGPIRAHKEARKEAEKRDKEARAELRYDLERLRPGHHYRVTGNGGASGADISCVSPGFISLTRIGGAPGLAIGADDLAKYLLGHDVYGPWKFEVQR